MCRTSSMTSNNLQLYFPIICPLNKVFSTLSLVLLQKKEKDYEGPCIEGLQGQLQNTTSWLTCNATNTGTGTLHEEYLFRRFLNMKQWHWERDDVILALNCNCVLSLLTYNAINTGTLQEQCLVRWFLNITQAERGLDFVSQLQLCASVADI
jgi:hypothetical protein